MDNIIKSIEEILKKKSRVIIAIDGNCAAGKSTLASKIAEHFYMQIIHTDDFFLPPSMRTIERLSKAGGNIHFERFNSEVISGIESGNNFIYRIFNCKNGEYSQSDIIYSDKSIIIEGSYSLHPEIKDVYDFRIFLEVDSKTQLERILNRNGKEALKVFKEKWIPMENKYFEAFNIKSKCDLIK